MKKIVIARLAINKQSGEEFQKLVAEIVAQSQKEEGCLSYNVYTDFGNEVFTYVFWEDYKNEAALENHNNSAHFKQFFAAAAPLFCCEPVLIIK
jgi:PTH1 family peptidyl-tRNA hydrolase